MTGARPGDSLYSGHSDTEKISDMARQQLWAITDSNFIRLTCLITACHSCSLMSLLTPGCGIHYCVPGPGPAWGVQWRQQPVAMSCPLAPAVMVWWPQPGPRVSSGSGLSLMTREPGHTGLAPAQPTGIMCLLTLGGHRHCVLIWPLVSPSHGSEGSQWQKVKQCPFDYRYQKSSQYWHTVRIRLSRFEMSILATEVLTREWKEFIRLGAMVTTRLLNQGNRLGIISLRRDY